MNIRKLTIAVTLHAGKIGIGGTSARADSMISKDVSTARSYRHMKFLTRCEEILGQSAPVLKNSIIDFYGSCDRDPRSKDEIQAQRLELEYGFSADCAG